MADVKISALPAATTPLAGTEVLPIVQSSTTKKVAISDVTAGRSVSAASLTLTTSPLAVGSGGTGLNSLTSGYIPYGNGTGAFSSSSGFTFDGTNLGIGGVPSFGLDVQTAAARVRVAPSTTTNYALYQGTNGGGSCYFGLDNSTGGLTGTAYAMLLYTNSGSPIIFTTNGSERLRITSAGDVGIGTTAPSSKLDILTATNGGLRVTDGSQVGIMYASGLGGIVSGTVSNHPYIFLANNGEKMRLDASGNLGLGVTPSAGYGALQVTTSTNGTAAYLGNGAAVHAFNSGGYFSSPITLSAAGVWTARANEAALLRMDGGAFYFLSNTGLTPGNTFSPTTRMTLDASGRLGVGVVPSNYKFAVTTSGYNIAKYTGAEYGFVSYYGGTQGFTIQNWAGVSSLKAEGSAAITFVNNDTERARIDSSGNLLVGTTDSAATTGVGIKLRPGGGGANLPRIDIVTSGSTSGTSSLSLYSTGASAFRFYVNDAGTINATSTTISGISDERFKENIRDLDDGLSTILSLKPRKFDWKSGKGMNVKNARGFIAQEFEQVFPDLIDEWQDVPPEGEEPYKSVRPDILPVLVKAIQELSSKLDAAEARIAALEGAN